MNAPSKEHNASRDVVRGVVWAVLMRWSMRFIGLFSTLILARLLTPDDFGVAAMGTLVLSLLTQMSEFGTSMHLIRAKEIDDAHCHTAWTVTLLQGCFVAAGLFVAATPAAIYFDEPRVVDVMHVLALAALIGGFENVGPVLMRREMQFSKDFRFNVFKKLFVFVATVSSAFALRSYWALVIGNLVGTSVGVVLSYVVHKYRPRFSLARGREYLQFGLAIIPLALANTLRDMLPSFLAAGAGSTSTLGSFRVASELSSMFTTEIVTPMGRGLLPNYARLADRPDELSAMYRRILGLVALVCLPVGAGVSAISSDLVFVLLGPQWGFAGELMQYFAIGAAIFAFSVAMVNQILVATGHEQRAAKLAWVRLGITLPVLWAGLQIGGVVGLSQATIVAPLLSLVQIYREVSRVVTLTVPVLLGAVWRPALAAACMFLAVKLLHAEAVDSAVVRLALDILAGAVVFVLSVLGLWWLSGKPNSAERDAVNAAARLFAMARLRVGRLAGKD
ncbi:MAG: lipopolysaccharide biosynthesis protein [Chromatiaceae bacterium]|nr:lipopolysaccharide biosynthesis protein [Chromatiaceae bacterium]